MNDISYPVELTAPDISKYRQGNTGIDYVTTQDSGLPGAHVMLSAVVHGNEVCGAHALDYLLREGVRPDRGKLTLAFMNVEAYARFNRPTPSRLATSTRTSTASGLPRCSMAVAGARSSAGRGRSAR